MEIGQVCMKIAGRDAGQECIVVDTLDGNFVLVDGNTRRRKCNIRHLEPLESFVKVKQGATHDEVLKAMKEAGLHVIEVKKGEKSVKKARPVAKRSALVKAEAAKSEPAKDKKAKAKTEKTVKK